MLDFILKLCGGGSTATKDATKAEEEATSGDSYAYPNLYEEADEMLQAALLMYIITDLRTLAKEKNTKLKTPERILDLPLTLETALDMIETNAETIQQELGSGDHESAMNALKSIQERYEGGNNPWKGGNAEQASLVAFGDEKPDKELVYAIGVDPVRKRVTVAFRGSATPADFIIDACIAFSKRENPLKGVDGQEDEIGLHHGFDDYLLKRRIMAECKYTEIMNQVVKLFDDKDRRENYKLYCTGHSLGGALATLFAFEAAAIATTSTGNSGIPLPVTCVSIASPRVGDLSFQKAFRHLEQVGAMRHLRVANAGDPVTIMPKSSSKKMLAMLSPIAYMSLKLQDQDFAERETYRHTGIKLTLMRPGKENRYEPLCDLSYSGITTAKEEMVKDDEDDGNEATASSTKKKKSGVFKSLSPKKSSKSSKSTKAVPNVIAHFGTAYSHRLSKVEHELSDKTLNELYLTMGPSGVWSLERG